MSSFLDRRKSQLKIKSLGEKIREGSVNTTLNPDLFVHGPKQIDCLTDKWARRKMLGIIGASGIGKTELVMEIFENILTNTKRDNSICVFVSLEMTTNEIAQRWADRVGDSPISDRFHVISRYDDDGKPRDINLKKIISEIETIKNTLGVTVDCCAIDHLHLIAMTQESTDLNAICNQIKYSAVELDTFMILLSQTQKSNNSGDVPLDQNASNNCSSFASICDFIITIHAPLLKVKDHTKLNVRAWQYAKIRNQSNKDAVKVGVNYLLSYDSDTRKLKDLTEEEKYEFKAMYEMVLELRDAETKNKFTMYNLGKNHTVSNEAKIFKD